MTIHQQGESIQDLKLIQVHLSFYPKDHAFSKVRSGQVRDSAMWAICQRGSNQDLGLSDDLLRVVMMMMMMVCEDLFCTIIGLYS